MINCNIIKIFPCIKKNKMRATNNNEMNMNLIKFKDYFNKRVRCISFLNFERLCRTPERRRRILGLCGTPFQEQWLEYTIYKWISKFKFMIWVFNKYGFVLRTINLWYKKLFLTLKVHIVKTTGLLYSQV